MPGAAIVRHTELTTELKTEGAEAAWEQLNKFKKEARGAEEASTKLERRLSFLGKTVGLLATVFATLKVGQLTAAAVQTSMEFERLDVQMRALTGSAKAAEKATLWVRQFTQATPYQLRETTEGFVRLKAFGLDPMKGSMQAVADQAALLGGSADTMNTIILALGKAWSRGKLEGEDFNMMLERGVPVARLLAEAMGVSEMEVLQFREAGLLTRDTLEVLVQAMEKSAEGASQAFMKTLPGMISNLQDAWAEAQQQFARGGGITDELKRAVTFITAEVNRIAGEGGFAKLGASIAAVLHTMVNALPRVYDGLSRVISLIYGLRQEALFAAKIFIELWAAQKIGRYLDYLNRVVLLMKVLNTLAKSSQFVEAMKFSQMAMGARAATTEVGALRQLLAGLSPAMQAAGNAALTAANKFASFAVMMYRTQIALMAAVIAGQALAKLLDTINNEHLKKGTFEYGGGEAVMAQTEWMRSMSQAERADIMKWSGGDWTKGAKSLYSTIVGREKAGKTLAEPDYFGQTFSEEHLARLEKFYDALKKVREERKKAAEAAGEDPMTKEIEEMQKQMDAFAADLGKKLQGLLGANKDAAAEALKAWKEAMAQALHQVDNLMDFAISAYEEYWQETEGERIRREQSSALQIQEANRAIGEDVGAAEFGVGIVDIEAVQENAKAAGIVVVDETEKAYDQIGASFRELLNVGMAGDLKDFGALWDNVWQGLAKSMIGIIGEAFTNMLEGREGGVDKKTGEKIYNLMDLATGKQKLSGGEAAGAVVGGLGMVYQGYQQGGTGGAIQGALGGAMAGLPLAVETGGISVIVGAILGGLAGWLGGTDKPKLPVSVAQGGRTTFDVSRMRGQYSSAEERETAAMSIAATYRDVADQWRQALREFGDVNLFDLVGDMPEIEGVFDMTFSEFQTWIKETKLPQMFQGAYGAALHAGFEELGLGTQAITKFFQELQEMPGTERMAALTTMVRALKGVSELLDMDFGALEEKLDKSVVDTYVDSMGDASEAMELLTSGWEDMSLTDRAEDLEKIGQIFESALNDTLQLLSQIDSIISTLRDQFEGLRSTFETKGMDEVTTQIGTGFRNFYPG